MCDVCEMDAGPGWTDSPTKNGAYWLQIPKAGPEICWIYSGRIWFAPQYPQDKALVADYLSYGACFYGPLPLPPAFPDRK